MTLEQVVSELAAKGSESIKRVLLKHGAKEPFARGGGFSLEAKLRRAEPASPT